jgi:hypothetical protein
MSAAFLKLWDKLGSRSALVFGRECVVAATWMFICLCIRASLSLLKLKSLVPYGLIFAMPAVINKVGEYFSLFKDIFPLLPVRLAECIIGRISQARMSVVIPAHFIGCIFSSVLFKLVCPLAWLESGSSALTPLNYPSNPADQTLMYKIAFLMIEIICVCLYVIIVLVLPDFLTVNKLPQYWTSILALPLFLLSLREYQSSFHPAANYAIWYLLDRQEPYPVGYITSDTCLAFSNGSNITNATLLFSSNSSSNNSHFNSSISCCLNENTTSVEASTNSTIADISLLENLSSHNQMPLQFERLLGPFIGAAVAGLICAHYFPDDESCWKNRRKKVE